MISVILPTYNRASQLNKTVGSVLNQTYKKFELIIVDDGSTDNTNEMIEGVDDERLKYIRYDKNRGACYARNLGINNAKYPIIAFQDSDDHWEPNYLEEQWKEFKKVEEKYDAQICRYKFTYDDKTKIAPSEEDVDRGINIHELFKNNIVSTQILMIKREALLDVGCFDERLPAFQDWDLAIRLMQNNHKINILNKVLVGVNVSEDSITRNIQARIEARNIIYKKNLAFLKGHIKDWYNLSYSTFRFYQMNSNSDLQKWYYFKNCIRLSPFNIKNLYLLYFEIKLFLKI